MKTNKDIFSVNHNKHGADKFASALDYLGNGYWKTDTSAPRANLQMICLSQQMSQGTHIGSGLVHLGFKHFPMVSLSTSSLSIIFCWNHI